MKAFLVVVFGKPRNKVKSLVPGDCLIGRGEECQVRTNSPWVSRQHCLLRVSENEVILQDLGSANGTLVNGKRLFHPRSLIPGDRLQIGPVVFEYRVDLTPEQAKDTEKLLLPETRKISANDMPAVEISEPLSVEADAPADETTRFTTY
jgi:pSer/pThr/pTyr-binding forkhead associated (FHA) protein